MNMTASRFRVLTYCALLVFFVFAGCDSNEDEDEFAASFEQMSNMIEESFNVFGEIAVEILLDQVAKNQPTYSCSQNGQVDYDESPVDPSLYELEFQNCNGINGNVDLGFDITVSETNFEFDLLLDGSLENECTLQFANFAENVIAGLEDDSQTITLSGSVFANCSGDRFACTFNNALLSEATADSIIEENCTATSG